MCTNTKNNRLPSVLLPFREPFPKSPSPGDYMLLSQPPTDHLPRYFHLDSLSPGRSLSLSARVLIRPTNSQTTPPPPPPPPHPGLPEISGWLWLPSFACSKCTRASSPATSTARCVSCSAPPPPNPEWGEEVVVMVTPLDGFPWPCVFRTETQSMHNEIFIQRLSLIQFQDGAHPSVRPSVLPPSTYAREQQQQRSSFYRPSFLFSWQPKFSCWSPTTKRKRRRRRVIMNG